MPRPSRQLIYERLERAVDDLEGVGGLPAPEEAKSIWEGIWHEEAHHSTAMEGNTLLMKEVQLLLFEGKAVGSKELKEYLEVQGYADAAQWVYSQAVKGATPPPEFAGITLSELREIHRLVVAPVWPHFPPPQLDRRERPGNFRYGEIEPLRTGLKPPLAIEVPGLVGDWVDSVQPVVEASVWDESIHPIERFAELHAAFERIHPFSDGNGRVGRLVLNLLLVRYGYPPAVIHKRDRVKYLDALKRADLADPGPLGELLARSVKHGIDRFLIPGLAGDHRYVPLSALTDLGLSHNALTLAAQRGRLEATQRGGQWYSSRECVEAYKRSRYKTRQAA